MEETEKTVIYFSSNDKDVAFFCEYFSARPVASSQITKNSSLSGIISVFLAPLNLTR